MNDPAIQCTAALDFWNLGADGQAMRTDKTSDSLTAAYASWLTAPGAPLRVADSFSLATELKTHGASWDVDSTAAQLRDRPVMVISTTDNGSHGSFIDALKRSGNSKVTEKRWEADHSFSARRIELARTLIGWLQTDCGYR
jgi:hypothetical protein